MGTSYNGFNYQLAKIGQLFVYAMLYSFLYHQEITSGGLISI